MKNETSMISRRDFIGKAAGGISAGLVLGAPNILRAAQGEPSEKIHIALVGFGKQGKVLLDAMSNIPGLHFQAVCDIWDYNLKGGIAKVRASAPPF